MGGGEGGGPGHAFSASRDSDRKNLFIFAWLSQKLPEPQLLSAVSRSSAAINTASIPQVG